jgi:hypothetical protein
MGPPFVLEGDFDIGLNLDIDFSWAKDRAEHANIAEGAAG